MQRLKIWAGLLGGLLILALAVASMASAHGGDANKIHSCVNNNSGTIKIVSPSQGCSNNETALDWNQGVAPADLAALQAQIAAAQAQINQVQAVLSAQIAAGDQQLAAQINNLQQTVSSQAAQIQSLQAQVNSQGNQISNLQQAVSSHSNSIGQLQGYDATLKGVLQQWQSAINAQFNSNVLLPVP